MKYQRGQYPRFDKAAAKVLGRELHRIALVQVRLFAKKEVGIFRRRIEAQRFPSFRQHPLAESTLARKEALGRSLRVMMSTKRYVKSLTVQRRKLSRGEVLHIGFDRRRLAYDTTTGRPRPGVTLNRVALMHEFGGPRAPYPARPHWEPHFRLMHMRSFALRERIRLLAMAHARRKMGIR